MTLHKLLGNILHEDHPDGIIKLTNDYEAEDHEERRNFSARNIFNLIFI